MVTAKHDAAFLFGVALMNCYEKELIHIRTDATGTMNVNIHVIMQNICTFVYVKYGTSVQDAEAVRKTPTTYPKEKFLISLVASKKKKKKGVVAGST